MMLNRRRWQPPSPPRKLQPSKRRQLLTQHRQKLTEKLPLHKHRSMLFKIEMKKLPKQPQMLPDKRLMQIRHEPWLPTEPLKHKELKLQSMQPSPQLLKRPKDFKMQLTQQLKQRETRQRLQERPKMQQQ